MSAQDQHNRPHRKQKRKNGQDLKSANPKAYALANPGRFQRQAARTHDVKEKRYHVPQVDRMPEEAPPLIVAVVGPPKVGKTTLIKSLIRRYTKRTVSDPRGPLTVVTSRRRRLTFIETPADSLAAMIDVAKVVDIVLLMIDGKYGFEMEVMEFLDVLKTSGMPGNIFGILTHLDLFRKPDALRTQKKRLKTRLWKDLYHGAKLFYLSGVINGRYPDREVLNLSRFLSVMKNPRPLVWRNSHPYCLADRFLDVTPPTETEANPKCDRTIALYGYSRGTNFPSQGARVHVPGLGDLAVADIEALPDPCPTPFQEQMEQNMTGRTSRRRLGDKQKVLYAPMSDVGGLLVDKDAVYINIKNPTFDKDAGFNVNDRGLGEQLVLGLQGDRELLGRSKGDMQLFKNGTPSNRELWPLENPAGTDGNEVDDLGHDDDYNFERSEMYSEPGAPDIEDDLRSFNDGSDQDGTQIEDSEKVSLADSESDIEDVVVDDRSSGWSEDEDQSGARWKEGLADRAQSLYTSQAPMRTVDLSRLMYDISLTPAEAICRWIQGESSNAARDEREGGGEEEPFFTTRNSNNRISNGEDRMMPLYNYNELNKKWTEEQNISALQHKFVGSHLNLKNGNEEPSLSGEQDEDSGEGDGEFEDLEADEKQNATTETELKMERELNARRKEDLKLRFEEEDRDGFANDKNTEAESQSHNFDEDQWYDAQKAKIQKQIDVNRAEFDGMDEASRVRAEGHKAGTYLRLTLTNVPFEFVAYFNAKHPLIIGGLNPTEERFGYLQVRIKKHRYYQRILKNKDPLIFSLGWRRFESIPMYAMSDHSVRQRMIKYTPEHDHCLGTFWGPLAAPNTGFCCVQSFSNKNPKFRLAATGTILSVDESVSIVKKVKLKGYPGKILKNTAYIRDMFSSDLEVEKFKSAKLKTVSGVRGMIKARAGHKFPQGWVRATFEDKILMSDIVFLSGWHSVKPPEYYNTVTNLLMDGENDDSSEWLGMRTAGRIRAEHGMAAPQLKDSQYRAIERANRHFNPLRITRKLASELPFKSQITQTRPQRQETYLAKRAVVLGKDEKRARDLMQKVSTMQNEKSAKRSLAQERRKVGYRKKVAENLERKASREKRERDEYWRREGRKRKAEGGESASKRRH